MLVLVISSYIYCAVGPLLTLWRLTERVGLSFLKMLTGHRVLENQGWLSKYPLHTRSWHLGNLSRETNFCFDWKNDNAFLPKCKRFNCRNYRCYCLIFRTPKYFKNYSFQPGTVADVKTCPGISLTHAMIAIGSSKVPSVFLYCETEWPQSLHGGSGAWGGLLRIDRRGGSTWFLNPLKLFLADLCGCE